MPRLISALIAAAGLAVCAWFALGIVQAENTDHATNILATASTLSPGQRAHVRALLGRAGTLNPGTSTDLLRAQLAGLEHRPRLEGEILERVTRAEPLNLDAWLALAQWGLAHNRAVLSTAVGHIHVLDPRLK